MNYEKLLEVSDTVMVSPRDLEQMLFILLEGSKKQIELQRDLGFPSSVMNMLPSELSDLVMRDKNRFSLKESAHETVEQLQLRREGIDAQVESRLNDATDAIKSIEQSRTMPYRDFDQVRALPESTVAKVKLIHQHENLDGRNIILMGDDDMVSIAIGFTGIAKRVTVLDIDREVLAAIQESNQRYNLKTETVLYNAKRALPRELTSKYAVAVTDPPYTAEGIALFVSRCLTGLGRKNGVIYLSYGYSQRAAERALPIQNALTQMGLVLEEVRPRFTRYDGALSIGSASSLYVCRMTPRSKPIVSGEFAGDIYTKTRPKR